MTYSTLTGSKATEGSIRFLINFAKVDAVSILRDAENWISQNLRVRRMRARTPLTLALGESSIDLATEVPLFLDPIRLWLQGFGALTFIHEDEIDERRAADEDGTLVSGTPTAWTVVGSELLFDTECDDSCQLVFSHYAKPLALSEENETNLYTEEYPALLRAAVTGYAYVERKEDERAKANFEMASGLIQKIAENDDLSRRGQEFTIRVT